MAHALSIALSIPPCMTSARFAQAGARKDLKTEKGSTALSLAQQNKHAALCALLQA